MRRIALVILLLGCSAQAAGARGGDDGGDNRDDVRVAGICSPGATSSLRVRAGDYGIEVRFRLLQTHGRGAWRVAIVHENRVAARAIATTTRTRSSFEVRRTVPNLYGSDTVIVHAWGPGGLGCRAAAALQDN